MAVGSIDREIFLYFLVTCRGSKSDFVKIVKNAGLQLPMKRQIQSML